MNSTLKSLLFWLVLVVAGVLIWNFATRYDARDHSLSFSEFMAAVDAGSVQRVVITGQEITGTTKDAPNQQFKTYAPTQYEGLANKLIANGKHLKAGDVILTGSVHPPQFLPGPGIAKTEFTGLGGAEITVR